MDYTPAPNIETTLLGLTLTRVEEVDDQVVLETADGRSFKLYHDQDCCESVRVHDIVGDLAHVLGSPLLSVEEIIVRDSDGGNKGWPSDVPRPEYLDSWTWSSFVFTTAKGSAGIRWVGQSNGYYSESVSFVETTR